jgi:glycosyltransferase involved in cell wall biosynthesis
MDQQHTNGSLVSIVLTTLNGARYIRDSIDSCLKQTYGNIELIVVDGGSTDGTVEIVESYLDEDPRVRLIHQRDNEGKLPGALNLGLFHARGAYLTWTQDDSWYESSALAVLVDCLESRPEIGQAYADWWLIRDGAAPEHIRTPDPDQLRSMKSDRVGVCFLLRREVREAVGEHTIAAFPSQDYDYRMRIAQLFESERIGAPLYHYRYHEASLTGRLGWRRLAHKDVEIRLQLGITTRRQARLDRAEADIAFAFERFQNGIYRGVPGLVGAAMTRDLRYVANRGAWSIVFRSLLPRSE